MTRRSRPIRPIARRAARPGFTLMEVLLVLAILGVIGALVIPNLLGSQEKANINSTRLQIKKIEGFAQQYAIEHAGALPKTLEELTQPFEKDGVTSQPITDTIPADPWGNPYNYAVDANSGMGSHQKIKKPDLWSNGPNGTNDNGTGDDINNWSELEESK